MMRGLYCAVFVLVIWMVSPVLAQSNRATINGSVVITTGNTFQKVLSAGAPWSVTIENNNATDSCWIQFGQGVTAANAAKGKSILLLPGGSWARYYPYVPSDEIEGTCASNSDTLYVDTQ
jgi:hypothetical protein